MEVCNLENKSQSLSEFLGWISFCKKKITPFRTIYLFLLSQLIGRCVVPFGFPPIELGNPQRILKFDHIHPRRAGEHKGRNVMIATKQRLGWGQYRPNINKKIKTNHRFVFTSLNKDENNKIKSNLIFFCTVYNYFLRRMMMKLL